MKKYIKPAIVEVKLDTANILAASDPVIGMDNTPTDIMQAEDLELDFDDDLFNEDL